MVDIDRADCLGFRERADSCESLDGLSWVDAAVAVSWAEISVGLLSWSSQSVFRCPNLQPIYL